MALALSARRVVHIDVGGGGVIDSLVDYRPRGGGDCDFEAFRHFEEGVHLPFIEHDVFIEAFERRGVDFFHGVNQVKTIVLGFRREHVVAVAV